MEKSITSSPRAFMASTRPCIAVVAKGLERAMRWEISILIP
jgi:hypothetical protein